MLKEKDKYQLNFLQGTCFSQKKENHFIHERACCFASLPGSLTLEASLVLPLFLFAMITCMLFGQIFIIEGYMHHGLVEAAQKLAIEQYQKEKKGQTMSVPSKWIQQKYAQTNAFPRAVRVNQIHISKTQIPNANGEICLIMNYELSVYDPLIGKRIRKITDRVSEKAFTGYEPSEFEKGNGYVYVTKYGTVYHTSMYCTHIMLRIYDAKEKQAYLNGATPYEACSKCIGKKMEDMDTLFIAKEGECYHSSLECSGLTRWIRKVTIWEVEGMAACSRCGN